MKTRELGSQGLEVSAIGLGTMGMTMAYGAGDERGGIETIRRAHVPRAARSRSRAQVDSPNSRRASSTSARAPVSAVGSWPSLWISR